MREILFRGKRIDNRTWLYGDLRQYREGVCGICDRALGHTRRVDLTTIGQFTGLTDKNGKKIFEGDIIFDQRPSIQKTYIVIWFGSSFCRRTKDGHYLSPLILNCNEFEIIGNIHDSPELTEGE